MSERYIFQDLPSPVDYRDWRDFAEALTRSLSENLQELHRLSEINDRPVPNRYAVSNHTDRRTLDESADTLAQTKNVLGTLLRDLVRKGVLTDKGST